MQQHSHAFISFLHICSISVVATYPLAGGRCEGSRVHLPREENARSHHQRLFEENVRKTKSGSMNFKYEKVRELFLCNTMTSNCFIFPFVYVFFFVLGSTKVGLLLLRILDLR